MRGRLVATIVGARRGRLRLALVEQGPLRLLGPDTTGETAGFTLANTSGAVVGNDRLATDIRIGAGARVRVRSVGATILNAGAVSFSHTRLRVDPGGDLLWLPGPTLPRPHARHRSRLTINVAPGGRLTLAELLHADAFDPELRATLTVRANASYDGAAAYRDYAAYGASPAAWGAFRCLGTTLALGEPFGPAAADALTALWRDHAVWGAASVLPFGGVSGRFLAPRPQAGRDALDAAAHLLDGWGRA